MEVLAGLAAVMITLAALGLVLGFPWRINLGLLGGIFLAVFILNIAILPPTTAIAKVVAGWISAVVLGMGLLSQPKDTPVEWHLPVQNRLFRLLAALLCCLALISLLTPVMSLQAGIPVAVAWGALALMGLGLLHLGFTNRPLNVVIGLLTTLGGFDLLYSHLERSILVAGLFASIQLLLALVGSYLLVAPYLPREEG